MTNIEQIEGGVFAPYIPEGRESKSTRYKILSAAYIEIHEVGFQAASIAKILKDTQLTKGALYHHFPSKLDLGYAVLDEMIYPKIKMNWVDPLKKSKNPIDTLMEIIQESEKKISMRDIEFGCPLNNLAQEMSPIDEGFRVRVDDLFKLWRRAISNALVAGCSLNLVKKDVDADAMAIMFIATLEGCIGAAKSAQDKNVLSKCGLSLAYVLNGLRA